MAPPRRTPSTRRLGARAAVAVALLGVVTSSSAAETRLPHRTVAVAAGTAITKVQFDHWIRIAAKGQASAKPGSPMIVPTDPPAFNGCIAQVRQQIPSLNGTPDRQIRLDCRQIFHVLRHETLDFLIRAAWYDADAASQRITVTRGDVTRALRKDKREQFKTRRAFTAFLRATGQTVKDIRFRVRVNLVFVRLIKREPSDLDVLHKARRLDTQLVRRYRSVTRCRRYYVINDCA
jgi:hypothetical protein